MIFDYRIETGILNAPDLSIACPDVYFVRSSHAWTYPLIVCLVEIRIP